MQFIDAKNGQQDRALHTLWVHSQRGQRLFLSCWMEFNTYLVKGLPCRPWMLQGFRITFHYSLLRISWTSMQRQVPITQSAEICRTRGSWKGQRTWLDSLAKLHWCRGFTYCALILKCTKPTLCSPRTAWPQLHSSTKRLLEGILRTCHWTGWTVGSLAGV